VSDQPGGGAPPPPGQPPQAPPPGQPPQAPPPQAPSPQAPPAQNWQSTPQQPGPPPAAGGQPSGMPSWTSNLTDQRPVAGPAGLFYADVPNRSIAIVIDVVAMVIVYFIIGVITLAIFGQNLGFGVTIVSTTSLLVQWLIGQAIWAAYFIFLWVSQRGTIGMKLLGLQIGHETDGRTITYQQAVYRYAVLFGPNLVLQLLAAFVPGLGILGFLGLVWLIYVLITIAQSPTKQGIHDRYAHTMIVKAGRSMIQPPS
jgi:uncharacterized RDD family membrane protein YckC